MGARKKLNSSYFLGSLMSAAAVGVLVNSWLVFLIALAVLVALNVQNGDIRFSNRRCR